MKLKDVLSPDSYAYEPSGVLFETDDKRLKELFDKAEKEAEKNIKKYNNYDVMVEGEKYNGVWMETQPMAGEMYAKRNIRVSLSNILIFLRYQRRDGKFPGMILHDACLGVQPYYDWMQGLFLPYAALKLYYLSGKDEDYLEALYTSLEDYDGYLWKYRDSDGDGCLETWCVWDTGEDNFTVHELNGINPLENGAYGGETAPEGYGNLPYESPQYMAYSYACRDVLSKISKLLNNGKENEWSEKAQAVRSKLKSYLWDDEKKACYARDKDNEMIYCITQENIKCMYEGIFDQEMADDFIREHFLNPEELWTPYPLPSIAANDPYFHVDENYSNCNDRFLAEGREVKDFGGNSWSGPVNGLTCQRSIDALLNYSHHTESIMVGERIIKMLKENKGFVQNYNPFTGKQHGDNDGYGPTLFALLEYVSVMYGVNIAYDKALWTGVDSAGNFEYTQKLLGKEFKICHAEGKNTAFIDGECIFEASSNVRVKTDLSGNIEAIYSVSEEKSEVTLNYKGKSFKKEILPNEELCIENDMLKSVRKIDFKGDTK